MPKLNIRGPDGQDRDVDLDDRDLRIGRADQNDIVLPDSTKSVSRLHAELRFEDGQYVMVDADSQNGIWVDGQRLPRVRLQPGVSVLVGEYRLTLNDAAALPKTTSVISTAVAGAAGTVLSRRPNPPKPMTSAGTTGASSSTRRAVRSTISPKAIIVGGVAIFVALAAAAIVVTVRRRASYPPPVIVAEVSQVPVVPPPPPPPTTEDQVRGHLAEARKHVDAREFDDAIAESDLALALDPANAEALALKSNATAEIRRLAPPQEPPHSDKPVPAKPAPAPPGPSPAASQRPGETVDDWYARGRRLQDQYDRAKAALSSGSFQTSINGLTALLRDEPSFRDAPSLLAQARNGLREAVQSVIEAAAKLEGGGDLRGALLQYQRAQQMGASDTADQDRVLARMKVEGTRAFNEAGTYFALSRFKDAIARYERAVDYLADDDPNRKIAKERLDGLRGRQ